MSKLSLILLLICLQAHAEELDTIEVNAEKDLSHFTFSDASTIESEELTETPLGLVAPAIEKTPGVVANQNGGPGGRVSFFIRGTESRHVAFTMDGMKLNDTSNVDRQFDAAFMTSPFLKSIVIHRGPQAVLYGSDALGGIVEMKTRKGESAPETRLLLNGGSFGTMDATLATDWANKKHQGTVTLTRFHTDGISRLNEKRFHAKEPDSADIAQVTSSSEHKWAQRLWTDFLASYLHGRSEQDGFGTDSKHDRSLSDQYIVQQKTNFEINKTQGVSLRTGMSRHQRFIRSEGTGTETYGGNLYQSEILHRLESGPFALLTGASNEHEVTRTNTIDKSFDLNSLFTQSSYKWDNFKTQAGIRSDHHSRYGSFLTGSGGVGYSLDQQLFSLQYSQGFKAPSLYQLYAPPMGGFPVGNENLVPERNHSWEASWKRTWSEVETGATLFQNRLSNLITFATNGYQNQRSFIAEGVELYGKWMGEKFQVTPSFTHQKFRNNETVVLRRPHNMGQLSVSYFPVETLEFNVSGRWYTARKDVDENGNTVKLNGFSVVDLGVNKRWGKDNVGLVVKNVLDREYEEIYGYSVLPLSVFAHYGHKF